MTRSTVALALLLLSSFVGRASAHGAPPAVTELLVTSEHNAALVRLTPGGFAHRVPDGFRFLCPESWGGDVLAPAAAIPLGPVLVASDSLFVIEQGGAVSLHPVQSGVGQVVSSQRDAVFGVFQHDASWELRRLTANTNELLRVLDQPVAALLAADSGLSLLRWVDETLVLLRLSLTGELLTSVTWTAPHAVASAHLRSAAGKLYVVVFGRSAPWVTLGYIDESGYQPLREASVDIAGPIADGTSSLIAVDGTLQTLDGGATVDTLGDRVTCLGQTDGESYACLHGDLFRVADGGVAAPWFQLSSLLEPDYGALGAAQRGSCSTRWLDLRVDVEAARAARTGVDAGVLAVDAGAPARIDAAPPDKTLPVDDDAAGCSALPGDTSRLSILLPLLLAYCLQHRRRR